MSALPEPLSNPSSHPVQGRSIPRSPTVTVRRGDRVDQVPTGTRVGALLPREVGGVLVVAGLLGQKPISLATPLVADASLAPLTTEHWEGRRIYARTVALVLLEAARRLWPECLVRLGPSRGRTQVVGCEGAAPAPLPALAGRLAAEMARVAAEDLPVRHETWMVEEAICLFEQRGWTDAAGLLRHRRENTVPLVACGETYALGMGPMLPSTAEVRGFALTAGENHLLLDLGARDPRNGVKSVAAAEASEDSMERAHEAWLEAMRLRSVGDFGEACVTGQVSQLINVAEGFHEKRIGQIADAVAAAGDRVRIIAVAGPSSSGKTTFIRRLRVQLQIDGKNPVGLSLDDYYVDREKTVRGPDGELDFEALEALDLRLLQDHVRRLLAGEAVRTARYDFKTGRSHPDGGPPLQLQRGDVLMMEGIHGLNPALLGDIPASGELYRVFVHPATTLAFDRLSRVSATDLRLLRRIVRDRHHRGYSAADNILRWPSVQAGERRHIFPYQAEADTVFDSSLIYEPAVLKVYAERYLLEVPQSHPAFPTAHRLRLLIDQFVSIYPDHVPPTSLLREFIGGSGFEY